MENIPKLVWKRGYKNGVRGNLGGASNLFATGFIHNGPPKVNTFN